MLQSTTSHLCFGLDFFFLAMRELSRLSTSVEFLQRTQPLPSEIPFDPSIPWTTVLDISQTMLADR
jgi:hypothetical protein